MKKALVIIDMQNDFLTGALGRLYGNTGGEESSCHSLC